MGRFLFRICMEICSTGTGLFVHDMILLENELHGLWFYNFPLLVEIVEKTAFAICFSKAVGNILNTLCRKQDTWKALLEEIFLVTLLVYCFDFMHISFLIYLETLRESFFPAVLVRCLTLKRLEDQFDSSPVGVNLKPLQFPEKFAEIHHIILNMWKFSSPILAIFAIISDFLTFAPWCLLFNDFYPGLARFFISEQQICKEMASLLVIPAHN